MNLSPVHFIPFSAMRSVYRLLVFFVVLGFPVTLLAQSIDLSAITTRAESSNYQETTSYDETVTFVNILTATSAKMFARPFGYSTEGRALPLVVFGDVENSSPEAVKASDKLRVFVQANIHAGEVSGKEAMLMLLRALAAGNHAEWADSLVLIVAPIYNADGNERLSLYNRPRQHGPIGGMGQRPNAQNLDLNRDHMKVMSPEARSLIGVFNRYDPHMVIDLHTTNGTRHGYHLTYSPALNPNTHPAIDALLREDLLPAVTNTIQELYGWSYYYYGNVPSRRFRAPRGWYTFDHRPRFNTNYVGLRNRIPILSEAYSYATFEDRVLATLYFVEEILNYSHIHAGAIRAVVETADATPVVGEELAVRAQHQRSEEQVEILLGEVGEEKHPFTGEPMFRRRDVQIPERMYEYGSFTPTETATAPEAYLVPPHLSVVKDRLEAHGVAFQELDAPETLIVERFRIDSTRVAARAFQGHNERTLFGVYEEAEVTVEAGTLRVPVSQPLGRLAFYLLEPRSDDGLTNWALLDDALENATHYPILRQHVQP